MATADTTTMTGPDRNAETEIPETWMNLLQEAMAGGGLRFGVLQSVLDALPAGLALLDETGRVCAVNSEWSRFAEENGLDPGSHGVGGNYLAACDDIAPASSSEAPGAAASLREVLAGRRGSYSFVYACRSGRQRWFNVHANAFSVGSRRGALVMLFDTTESILAEQRLFQLAHFDSLTGLPNRVLFMDRLRHTLATAGRYGKKAAVMLIDLDRFKMINDTMGYGAGDQLLQQFGKRLQGQVRQSDTVARPGGDEFAIILPELQGGAEAGQVAHKLLDSFAQPFEISGQDVFMGGSIGIAIYPDDASDADTLLGYADMAMYRVKEAGRQGYQFYTQAINHLAMERLRLDTDLRRALARREFELYYQPKVSCTTGEIVGTEALIRWNHPTHGVMVSSEFVPMLEEAGLITAVGDWVLQEACRQLKAWMDAGLGKPSVAVNLSARQFDRERLLATVKSALETHGLPPEQLELELTEGVLMRNAEHIIPTLNALRRLGVRLSVDDFGTGYASLSYLKRFPLDAIKVDRSFVQDITADPDDASITRAVITMAHNLKLQVIAEGVETEGQLALLVANQCDEFQGYIFSHPVPAADMEAQLREGRRLSVEQLRPEKRQRTVLLVDDEENILASMRRLLRRDGYRILTANSGQQGLEALASNAVDVILSDQRMPGMTGVEFLRQVKTLYPDTVRMVLSGYTELQSVTDAINEGAIYKFLTKPWEDDLLRAHIEEAFRYKELADDNRRLHQEIQVANKELAHSNQQLRQLLEEKQRQLVRDETMIDIAQELLHRVPAPIIGVDDEGMVVFANEEARRLLGKEEPLLGALADEYLPAPLLEVLRSGNQDGTVWQLGTTAMRVSCREMGENSRSRGRLLIFMPEGSA